MTKKPLLAADFDMTKARFPAYASPKIDGLRCRVINLVGMSRSMKQLPNKHLQSLISGLPGIANYLDGELTVGHPNSATAFQDSTGPLRSTEGRPDVVFNVFDSFEVPSAPYSIRAKNAATVVGELRKLGHTWIRWVGQEACRSLSHLDELEQKYLGHGYEGLMLRSAGGVYKAGRSTVSEGILLKVKRYVDFEAEVIGFEEEMQNTNVAEENEVGRMKRSSHMANMVPKGTLGAIKGRMINGPFKGVEISCGSGFTHAQRAAIWANRDNHLGRVFTVKYFPHGCKDKPRHPVFLRWRMDYGL